MNPRVAVGADGTTAVSWTYEDPATQPASRRKVQVAVRPAGQLAWTTATLADGTPGGVAIPHFVPLAVDATGDATVGWSGITTLGPGPTESAMYPDLATGANGDAGIVYSVSRCAGCNMPEVAMYSVRRGPTANWTTTTIGKGTAFSSYLEVLNLEVGSGKVARAVWKNAKTGTQWYAAGIGP